MKTIERWLLLFAWGGSIYMMAKYDNGLAGLGVFAFLTLVVTALFELEKEDHGVHQD